MLSSVSLQSLVNISNVLSLWLLNSKREPTISPMMAPITMDSSNPWGISPCSRRLSIINHFNKEEAKTFFSPNFARSESKKFCSGTFQFFTLFRYPEKWKDLRSLIIRKKKFLSIPMKRIPGMNLHLPGPSIGGSPFQFCQTNSSVFPREPFPVIRKAFINRISNRLTFSLELI